MNAVDRGLGEPESSAFALLEQLGEGVCHLQLLRDGAGRLTDWQFLYANPAIETLFEGGALTGRCSSKVFPRLHREQTELIDFLDATDRSGRAAVFEGHILPKGRWLRLSVSVLKPGHLAIVAQEITERVRHDRALREREERLMQAVTSAQAGAYDLNLTTGEALWSAACFALFGFQPGEFVPLADSWKLRTHPEDVPPTVATLEDSVRRGERELQIEYRSVWPDGSVHWLRSLGCFVYEPGGSVRVVGVIIDVTLGKEMELQLRYAHDQLEQRVRERTEALNHRTEQLARLSSELILAEQRERDRIARVLHDGLQQVLYATQLVIGGLGRHDDDQVRSVAQEITSFMDEATRQARTLTAEISPSAVHGEDLNAALRWLANWAQRAYGLKVRYVTEFSGRPPQAVQVLVYQTVRELLFNVAKHAGVTQACIKCTRVPGAGDGQPSLIVSVQDEGAGFEATLASGGDAGSHSGLGLFAIQERLIPLGGALNIDSAPGKGSRVTISLPLQERSP